MPNGSDEHTPKRWTAKRRSALVLDMLRGTVTIAEAARAHGLTIAEIEQWKERFLTGAEHALRTKPLDDEALNEQELKRLQQNVGELVMDVDIGHPLGEGGNENKPFQAADVRRVRAVVPAASLRHICRVLHVPRSALYQPAPAPSVPVAGGNEGQDEQVTARIHTLIQAHPTYGYRRIWARLRFGDGLLINRKRVYRLMRRKRWLVYQRPVTAKPRVHRRRSVATRRNERWAMDVTHIPVGRDGWAHRTAVIDWYDRELVGFECALRGRAKEAERALEAACVQRFGTIRPAGVTPILRSDTGLVFQSRRFRQACAFVRLEQAYITPSTPEQNGMIERFFRSLKEECIWQHTFESFVEAQVVINAWIRWSQRGATTPSPRVPQSTTISTASTSSLSGLTDGGHYTASTSSLSGLTDGGHYSGMGSAGVGQVPKSSGCCGVNAENFRIDPRIGWIYEIFPYSSCWAHLDKACIVSMVL